MGIEFKRHRESANREEHGVAGGGKHGGIRWAERGGERERERIPLTY